MALIPAEILNYFEEAQSIYRTLHKTPEILYDLPFTSSFVSKYLRDLGLEVHENIGRSGVVGIIRGQGPCILLRADMDALPVSEETDLDYKSTIPGRMHACGHDAHTAMLLIAAKILANTQNLNGSIKFVFQPAEEGGAGAKSMKDDGVLEGVDEVYAVHVVSPMKTGDYLYNDTYMSVNSDRFFVNITGKGGHGSAPADTIDPIPIAAQLILSFNSLGTNNSELVRIVTTCVDTSKT